MAAMDPTTPATKVGETLFILTGGPLRKPLAVPLWVQPEPDADEKCSLFYEWFFFQTTDGHVYIGQYNGRCGGAGCRIFDPVSGQLTAPSGGCIGPPTMGLHYHVRSLGGPWIEVNGDAEGSATVQFATWTPESQKDVQLEIGLGNGSGTFNAQLDGDGLLLSSSCDLLPGGAGCSLFGDSAGQPVRRYRWTKAGGVVLQK